MTAANQAGFQERVARLRAAETARMDAQPRVPDGSLRENARYPLSFVAAFAAGVLVAVLGRYCQFHMLGLPAQAENPDMQLVMDNVFAGLVAVVIRLSFDFATREHMLAKMAGVWLVIVTFHNLPHWAPAPMGALFSEAYVQQVRGQTDGNSILFRGMEFPFGSQSQVIVRR